MLTAQILCVIIALIIFVLTVRFSINREGIEINHATLCGFGFLFYWLLPIVFGVFGIWSDDKTVGYWFRFFQILSEDVIVSYLLLTAASAICFFLGCYFGDKTSRKKNRPYISERFDPRVLRIPLVCAGIFTAIYAYLVRNTLFQGYTVILPDIQNNGPFVAGAFFLFLLLVFNHLRRMEVEPGLPFWRIFVTPFFLIYAIFELLVLSIGDRIYLLTSSAVLIVLYSNYVKRINVARMLMLFGGAGLVAGSLGVIRLGHAVQTNPLMLVMYEPLLDSIPLIATLKQNLHEAFRFPVYLLQEFANLLPSVVTGEKPVNRHPVTTVDGFWVIAPLGGLNSYTSFMMNFGDIGTVLFFFAYGFAMSRLKAGVNSMLKRMFYVMLSGCTAFTFFRDPFYISIVKMMVEFSLIIPFLLLSCMRWLSESLFTTKPIAKLYPKNQAMPVRNALASSAEELE